MSIELERDVLRGKDRKCMYFSLSCSPHRQGQKINTIICNFYLAFITFKHYSSTCSTVYIHDHQVTRICDMTSISPTNDLPNCDSTKRVCVTYSKNRRYAYKCQETDTFQERRGKHRISFYRQRHLNVSMYWLFN